MPLIEVTTNRTVCASIRMEEATASQVDQYAAFIKASADDVVDKALGYVFSKDRDFQDFLKTDEARKSLRFSVSGSLRRKQSLRPCRRSLLPGWSEWNLWRFGRHEPPSEPYPVQERCCAPGKS